MPKPPLTRVRQDFRHRDERHSPLHTVHRRTNCGDLQWILLQKSQRLLAVKNALNTAERPCARGAYGAGKTDDSFEWPILEQSCNKASRKGVPCARLID